MPAGFFPLTVKEINRETKDAVSISFDIPEHLVAQFSYLAGQYLTFSKVINGEEVRRSYSVCSSPVTQANPTIAVKEVESGKMSTYLNRELSVGDVLDVMPPMGKFTVTLDASASKHYFLFGGGSGITPLLSIIKTVLVSEPNSKCYLYYANTDEDSIIFKQELDALNSQYDNFTLFYSLDNAPANWSGDTGHLTEGKVSDLVRNNLGLNYPVAHYFTCGPTPMMQIVEAGLKATGVRDENINVEYFTAAPKKESNDESSAEAANYSDEVIERTVKMEVFGEQKDVVVKPEQTILIAAQDAGLDPPYSCTVGVCTTCRARLRSGKAKMDEREGLSDTEIEMGYILTCQAHPLSDDVDLVFE